MEGLFDALVTVDRLLPQQQHIKDRPCELWSCAPSQTVSRTFFLWSPISSQRCRPSKPARSKRWLANQRTLDDPRPGDESRWHLVRQKAVQAAYSDEADHLVRRKAITHCERRRTPTPGPLCGGVNLRAVQSRAAISSPFHSRCAKTRAGRKSIPSSVRLGRSSRLSTTRLRTREWSRINSRDVNRSILRARGYNARSRVLFPVWRGPQRKKDVFGWGGRRRARRIILGLS